MFEWLYNPQPKVFSKLKVGDKFKKNWDDTIYVKTEMHKYQEQTEGYICCVRWYVASEDFEILKLG